MQYGYKGEIMNKKEAIKWLRHCAESDCDDCIYENQPIEWCSAKMKECVDAVEEALSVKPTDLISRAAALEQIAQAECGLHYEDCKADNCTCDCIWRILNIPPADVPTKCIAQINIDVDKIVKKIKDEYEIVDKPIGEWIPRPYEIDYENDAECSICGEIVINGNGYSYCPNCGIEMKSKKEEI